MNHRGSDEGSTKPLISGCQILRSSEVLKMPESLVIKGKYEVVSNLQFIFQGAYDYFELQKS